MSRLGTVASSDRGAVSIVVALLLAGGFLVGFIALTVDTGNVIFERRILQNAGDASSIALAQLCADDTPACSTTQNLFPEAQLLADKNSHDRRSDVTMICGETNTLQSGSFVNKLTACSAVSSATFDCGVIPAQYNRYIRVHAITNSPTTSNQQIWPVLNQVSGSSNTYGLRACSHSVWGKAASAPVALPIAIPLGNFVDTKNQLFSELVTGGGAYACQTPNCPTLSTLDGPYQPSAMPNGFGYLDLSDASGNCVSNKFLYAGFFVPRATTAQKVCGGANEILKYLGIPSFIPAISDVTQNTGNGNWEFKVAAFFRFTLRGFKIVNQAVGDCPEKSACSKSDWPSKCNSSTACIYGDFGRAVVPGVRVSVDPTIPNMGVQAVEILR